RVAAGKHREGSITIRVERTGNLVTIEIDDDGAGLDAAAIRTAAIARGIVSDEETVAMSDADLYQLVFRPGFSTRTEVSETSGRVRTGHASTRYDNDGRLLPLVDLGAVLALRSPAVPADGGPLLVIASLGYSIALVVDELIGDRELVVRPLPAELHDVPAYQG